MPKLSRLTGKQESWCLSKNWAGGNVKMLKWKTSKCEYVCSPSTCYIWTERYELAAKFLRRARWQHVNSHCFVNRCINAASCSESILRLLMESSLSPTPRTVKRLTKFRRSWKKVSRTVARVLWLRCLILMRAITSQAGEVWTGSRYVTCISFMKGESFSVFIQTLTSLLLVSSRKITSLVLATLSIWWS